MTQMTLMTLNPGYGIGYPQNSVISVTCVTIVTQEQRGGLGIPQKCVCGYPNAMLAKHVYSKTVAIKPDSHINSYKFQSESI